MATSKNAAAWTELNRGARSGLSSSIWMGMAPAARLRPLQRDLATDVCVIGAGISGLTTAYLLLKAGRKVVVVDDGPIGSGETDRTTAHLTCVLDDRFHKLAHWHSEATVRGAAESHTAAIQLVEDIAATESIDCDFARLDGYLFQPDGRHSDELDRELDAAHRAGLPGVRRVDRAPWANFDTGACLRFPGQAQIHPLEYLRGLARAVRRLRGEIFTGSRISKADDDGQVHLAVDGGWTITASHVVHATNAPLDAPAEIYLKQFPFRTYVIAAPVATGSAAPGLYWDDADPYHYVRLARTKDGESLIVGGEDHATGKRDDGDERFARLEEWTRERFPGLGPVHARWSGQVFEPVDGLALIGRYLDRPHQYVITGGSGNGFTYGTLGGRLICDLITGVENRWQEIYDPKRTPTNVKAMLAMGLPAASSYVRNVLAGEKDGTEIEKGTGMIIDTAEGKLAVFRDAAGLEHRFLAKCTHRGCVVEWNSTERTWDCPCHGSRFAPNGELLTGPAMAPLESANRDAPAGESRGLELPR